MKPSLYVRIEKFQADKNKGAMRSGGIIKRRTRRERERERERERDARDAH